MPAPRYWQDIHHRGLGLHTRVSGASPDMVQWTARATLAQWEERWQRQQQAAHKRATREHARASKAAERAYREERREEAQA